MALIDKRTGTNFITRYVGFTEPHRFVLHEIRSFTYTHMYSHMCTHICTHM